MDDGAHSPNGRSKLTRKTLVVAVILQVLIEFVPVSRGDDQNTGSTKDLCNNTTVLESCWSQIPPLSDIGIPATPEAVDTACEYVYLFEIVPGLQPVK